jgi:hypothetical protein
LPEKGSSVNWVGEFFRALPDVAVAFWEFGDGFRGLIELLVSAGLAALFLFAAVRLRPTQGWLSAIFGAMSATIAMWWAFGILPSAWVYFVDGEQELLEGTVIPSALPGMENFYEVFRDSVVIAETAVAVIAFAVVAAAVQKRYPRELAEGEEAAPKSGGYK